jgi:hypothetical protein
MPVPIASRSKARMALGQLEDWNSEFEVNARHGCSYVRVFRFVCACVLSCAGRGALIREQNKFDRVGVHEVKWEKCGIKPVHGYTFLC